MTESTCKHPDVRKFDGIRCCLSCGEAVFEASSSTIPVQTNAATAPYEYTKLNYKLGREIRLILLLPGIPEDAIRCEIIHVNLDDNPLYDAVSYTWATEDGDACLSNAVLCVQGGYIPVTSNCEAVLRHLRRLGRRRLWVDAICIDQTNVSERNHQVELMDLVYTRAGSVYSCIDNADNPLNYGNLFRWLQGEEPQYYTRESVLTDLQRLFSLRYFTRVWVIQEVALAQTAYLLVNDDVLPLTPTVIGRMKYVCTRRKLPSVLRWSLGQNMKLGIIACLHTSNSCQATDPRDRVFAVMGLMEAQTKSLIPVDYSLDLQLIYRIVIAAIIATQQKLDVLLFSTINQVNPGADWRTESCLSMEAFQRYLDSMDASYETEASKLFTWPSPWCATISVAVVPPSDFCDASKHENTSCVIERPQSAPSGLLPRLRVRAHYIDTIRIPHLDVTTESSYERGTSGTNDTRILDCFRREVPFYDTSCTVEKVGKASRALPNLFPTFSTVQEDTLTSRGRSDVNSEDLVRFLRRGSISRSWLMFSSRFSVGYRPPDSPSEAADEVFAIDGAKALFILRKTATQQYRIVSECYLWAAWELDCWNPGTRKGRWGPSVLRPTVKQTRMIEIY